MAFFQTRYLIGLHLVLCCFLLQYCQGASIQQRQFNCKCVSKSDTGTYIGNCNIPDVNEEYFCYVYKEDGSCCEGNSEKFTNLCRNYSLCKATVYDQKPKAKPYIIAAFFWK